MHPKLFLYLSLNNEYKRQIYKQIFWVLWENVYFSFLIVLSIQKRLNKVAFLAYLSAFTYPGPARSHLSDRYIWKNKVWLYTFLLSLRKKLPTRIRSSLVFFYVLNTTCCGLTCGKTCPAPVFSDTGCLLVSGPSILAFVRNNTEVWPAFNIPFILFPNLCI